MFYRWFFVCWKTNDAQKNQLRNFVFQMLTVWNERIIWHRDWELHSNEKIVRKAFIRITWSLPWCITKIWIEQWSKVFIEWSLNESKCFGHFSTRKKSSPENKICRKRTWHQNWAWSCCNNHVKSSIMNVIRSVHCSIKAKSFSFVGTGI